MMKCVRFQGGKIIFVLETQPEFLDSTMHMGVNFNCIFDVYAVLERANDTRLHVFATRGLQIQLI